MGKGKPRHAKNIAANYPANPKADSIPKRASSSQKQVFETPDQANNAKLRFRFDLSDDTNWPLHKIRSSDHRRLLKRLKYFEGLTVQQARENKVLGDYDMTTCPNQNARTVLKNQHDGLDTLCKLVIEPSGALRLFGIRKQNVIHILWWDSRHEVWPEGKQVR